MIKFHLAFLGWLALCGSAQAFVPEGCREKLATIIHLGDSPTSDPKYVDPFLETYDLLPAKAKNYMCKFKRFSVVDMKSSANSFMNFRKGIIDSGIDSGHWHSWKDQLNFGAKNDDTFPVSNKLPTFKMTPGIPFIYWSVIHELGHHLKTDWEQWDKFFLEDYAKQNVAERLCFYYCKTTLDPSEAASVYEMIFSQTNFLSLYSAIHSWESWAETFMCYVAIELNGFEATISTPNGVVYKMSDRLSSEGFKERRQAVIKAYEALGELEPKSDVFNLDPGHFY